MSRPEHSAPPEIFYGETEAKKYATSSRMIEIQSSMACRALELLMIPSGESRLLLDIGCGTGLSGSTLSEAGHTWVGLDISEAMLNIGLQREDGNMEDGDMLLHDMGQGLPFRPGTFDGAISISALQWLCNQDKKAHNPRKRIMVFFQSLYNCLVRGARAVFQFYPENPQQVELLTSCAMRCGFSGGLVVDYPNSAKAKKFFLCLFAGMSEHAQQDKLPAGLVGEEEMNEDGDGGGESKTVGYEGIRKRVERRKKGKKANRVVPKSKEWITAKKERQRRQGKKVRPDTHYTARKRPKAF